MEDREFQAYLGEPMRAHVSWLTPAWIEHRTHFDAKRWVAQLAGAGMRDMLFYAKFHDGYCTFRSRYRDLQPERDFLRELCDAAKPAGLGITVYYSSGVDRLAAQEHPDWVCRDLDGSFLAEDPSRIRWLYCCFNSGYRDFLIGQIGELVEDYDVAGVWLDLLSFPYSGKYGFHTCYCPACQKKFIEWTNGRTLLECKGTDLDKRFRAETEAALLADVRKRMDAGGRKRALGFNDSGTLWHHGTDYMHYRGLDRHADYLSMEGLWMNDPRNISFNARLARSSGKPFEIIAAVSDSSVSWSARNTDLILLEAANIAAHGGTAMMCLDPSADGHLFDHQVGQLAEANRYVSRWREYNAGSEPVCDVAILGHKNGSNGKGGRVFSGWGTAMLEKHVPFRFLYPEQPPDGDRVCVVDGTYPLSGEMRSALVRYVREGGNLVVDFKAAGFFSEGNEAFEEMLGVRCLGDSPYNVHYLGAFDARVGEGIPDYPVKVRGRAYRIRCEGAEPLAAYHYPLANCTPATSTFTGIVSPRVECSGDPAITLHRFGKGRAVFIGCDFGNAEMVRSDPSEASHAVPMRLADNIVAMLLDGKKSIRVQAPPGVEVVLNRQPGRQVVQLFNQYNVPFLFCDDVRGSMTLSGIRIGLREENPGAVRRVARILWDGQVEDVPFARADGCVWWDVGELKLHEGFVAES